MSPAKKDPFRTLTDDERAELIWLGRSEFTPVAEATRAKILPAVATGDDHQTADRPARPSASEWPGRPASSTPTPSRKEVDRGR